MTLKKITRKFAGLMLFGCITLLTGMSIASADAIADGKKVAFDRKKGNCLACHQLPIPGIEAYGTIGPPLAGIAARLSVPQIRLRVVDTRNINPLSIMPGFYRDPRLINRPGKAYRGRTFLTALQVEDVIAYMATLK